MEMKRYLEQSARTVSEFPAGLHLDRNQVDLLHASMGMCTEAAEFLDALKKHIFYGKKLDLTNLQEEVGDQLWYLALALRKLNTDFEAVAGMNIDKLYARYPEKFDARLAINRDVENELKVMAGGGAARPVGTREYKVGDIHPSGDITDFPGRLDPRGEDAYLGRSGMRLEIPVTAEEEELARAVAVPLDGFIGADFAAVDSATWASVPVDDLLSTDQESKYGGCLYKRSNGETLPKDEPLFILRAQDRNAANTLRYYAGTLKEPDHKQAVLRRIQDFLAFAAANPLRMKEPDTHTVAEV